MRGDVARAALRPAPPPSPLFTKRGTCWRSLAFSRATAPKLAARADAGRDRGALEGGRIVWSPRKMPASGDAPGGGPAFWPSPHCDCGPPLSP